MELQQKAQALQLEIHRQLIELASLADEQGLVLFVEINGDYMNRTGSTGANVILNCEVKVEEIK